MAFTATQKAAIRYYAGWAGAGFQFDTRLEGAMSAIESVPAHEAQITNALNGSPPGLLALLQDIDARITAALGRLKAAKVGSIELNPAEMYELRRIGRQYATRLCSILGVYKGTDVFSSGQTNNSLVAQDRDGYGFPAGYVGK